LPAEHRFIKRDRQIDPQIAAIDLKKGCGAMLTVIRKIARAVALRGLARPFSRIC